MTGIERRKFEMLLRVRNFGNTHAALFAALPVAQQTLAAVGTAIDDLTTTNMQKMVASTSVRADQKAAAREELTALLRHVSRLARNLRAEGHTMPGFKLPPSKNDVALVTAGRQFASDAARFEVEFSGHGMSPAHITDTTDAFETATNERGTSRVQHVAAQTRIQDLLAAAIRGVERLDLIVAIDLGHDNVVQAEWAQLRRVEEARGPRNGGEPAAPVAQPQAPAPQQPATPALHAEPPAA
jgi:hypothetical protein